MKHRTLLIIAGISWALIGFFLMFIGFKFLTHPTHTSGLYQWLSTLFNNPQLANLVLIVVSVLIGRFKGRFVFEKTVARTKKRLIRLGEPLPLAKLYPPPFYLLILFMIFLGFLMKWLDLPQDLRGVVDVAVGYALFSGALAYFRAAKTN